MIIDRNTDINTVIEEDVIITNSATFHMHGILNGNIYVEENSTFYLHGILNGDLTTKANSSSQLSGIMNGNILKNDGKIKLSGILNTKLVVPQNLVKEPGCYINGEKYW